MSLEDPEAPLSWQRKAMAIVLAQKPQHKHKLPVLNAQRGGERENVEQVQSSKHTSSAPSRSTSQDKVHKKPPAVQAHSSQRKPSPITSVKQGRPPPPTANKPHVNKQSSNKGTTA